MLQHCRRLFRRRHHEARAYLRKKWPQRHVLLSSVPRWGRSDSRAPYTTERWYDSIYIHTFTYQHSTDAKPYPRCGLPHAKNLESKLIRKKLVPVDDIESLSAALESSKLLRSEVTLVQLAERQRKMQEELQDLAQQKQRAEADLAALKEDDLCAICYVRKPRVALQCGHLFCSPCLATLPAPVVCPFCRRRSAFTLPVFKPWCQIYLTVFICDLLHYFSYFINKKFPSSQCREQIPISAWKLTTTMTLLPMIATCIVCKFCAVPCFHRDFLATFTRISLAALTHHAFQFRSGEQICSFPTNVMEFFLRNYNRITGGKLHAMAGSIEKRILLTRDLNHKIRDLSSNFASHFPQF